MSKFNYVGQQLSIDPTAYKMGERSFQSFLLAGERNVLFSLNKKNTDEERFETFFKALNQSQQDKLRDHFKRQAQLSSADRRELLGSLERLKITDPLTAETTLKDLIRSPIHQPGIQQIARMSLDSSQISLDDSQHSITSSTRKLTLNLEEIKVLEADDGNTKIKWSWKGPRKKRVNEVDEVLLKVVSIDASGRVSSQEFDFGSIKEGKTKSFQDKELCSFDIHSVGNWPKRLTMLCYAIEDDPEDAQDGLFEEVVNYVKSKIDDLILAAGAYYGVAIPKDLADKAASFVKGFIDGVVDWWNSTIRGKDDKEDDAIGQVQFQFDVNKDLYDSNKSAQKKSTSADWHFRGGKGTPDGHWRAKIHLKLFEEVDTRPNLVRSR